MKLALTYHRSTMELVSGEERAIRLLPLNDGVEIGGEELKTFVKDSCCSSNPKWDCSCIFESNHTIPRALRFHFKGNKDWQIRHCGTHQARIQDELALPLPWHWSG